MRSLASVFSAFANLATSLNTLAGVIDAAAGRLRQQLTLGTDAAPVIEHQTSDVQAPAPETETPSGKRRKAAV